VIDADEATGPCFARHVTQSLYRGEDYFLSLDSHMRMVQNWDELLIEELSLCKVVGLCLLKQTFVLLVRAKEPECNSDFLSSSVRDSEKRKRHLERRSLLVGRASIVFGLFSFWAGRNAANQRTIACPGCQSSCCVRILGCWICIFSR
jgi:hypothetical protein